VPALSGIPATAMSGALLNVTSLSAAVRVISRWSSGSSARDAATVAFTHASLVKTRAIARLAGAGTFTVTDKVPRATWSSTWSAGGPPPLS